jgi:hypothetical protein
MENNTDNNDKSQVAWNVSSSIIDEIAKRLEQSSDMFMKGNYAMMFHILKILKHRIIQSLSPDERTTLNRQEQKIIKLFNQLNGYNKLQKFEKEKINHQKIKYSFQNYVINYNDIIMDILNSHGYLIAEKADVSSMIFD